MRPSTCVSPATRPVGWCGGSMECRLATGGRHRHPTGWRDWHSLTTVGSRSPTCERGIGASLPTRSSIRAHTPQTHAISTSSSTCSRTDWVNSNRSHRSVLGFPTGARFIVTGDGDLATRDVVVELPEHTEAVLLGHDACITVFSGPDGADPLGEWYTDLSAGDIGRLGVRAIAGRSAADTFGAHRWMLDVPVGDDHRWLAVEISPRGTLGLTDELGPDTHFRLAVTPGLAAPGPVGLTVRSALLDTAARLAPDARCEVMTGSGVIERAPNVPQSGADLAFDTYPAPRTVEIDVMFEVVDQALTVMRWSHHGVPHQLQLVLGRLHLVADDRWVIESGEPLEAETWYRVRLDSSDVAATLVVDRVAGTGTRPVRRTRREPRMPRRLRPPQDDQVAPVRQALEGHAHTAWAGRDRCPAHRPRRDACRAIGGAFGELGATPSTRRCRASVPHGRAPAGPWRRRSDPRPWSPRRRTGSFVAHDRSNFGDAWTVSMWVDVAEPGGWSALPRARLPRSRGRRGHQPWRRAARSCRRRRHRDRDR